jgi:hypothetical protein
MSDKKDKKPDKAKMKVKIKGTPEQVVGAAITAMRYPRR